VVARRLTDAVLKEVANTKEFTTINFWGTHEGNLEMDDTNEVCIFDGADPVSNRPNGTQPYLSTEELSLLTLLLLAWLAV
jgi:hypothetical protein